MTRDRFTVLSLPGAAPVLGPAPAAAVRVTTVDTATARTAAQTPNTFIVPANMPLRLLAPIDRRAVAAAAANETTWGISAVGADRSPMDGSGVVVGVLDTGCDTTHEALRDKVVAAKSFVGPNATNVTDSDGHGTHCAGTICGGAVGGHRIGVAPGARLVVAKVLGGNGGGAGTILEAMQWAAQQGATILSMSLGIDFPGWVEELVRDHDLPIPAATALALRDYRSALLAYGKLADYLASQGVLVVGAAGNESVRPRYTIEKSPPAVAEPFVSVGAIGQDQQVAEFSNTGPDLSAPGVDVVSAAPGGGLASMSGTSMATPHVAGLAALWTQRLRAGGAVTHRQLVAQLLGGTRPLPGTRDDIGAGLAVAPA